MKYAIAIYGSSGSSQSGQSALSFTRAALQAGHEVIRLFFYQEGVHQASTLPSPPQDEQNLSREWQALVSEYDLDAVVCIAAALRRGVVDKAEAERYELPANNLSDGFQLSGLGQLLDAAIEADRLITFGA